MGRMSSQRGFTLVELMIIVTLLGIFAAIAVPSFSRLIENNRVQAANNELVSLLQYARAYAVQNRTSVRACLQNGTVSVKKSCDDTDALRRMSIPDDVQIASSEDEVRFRRNGSAEQATTYTTCRGGDAANGFTVTVAAAGSIRAFARGRSGPDNAMTECSLS